MTELYEPEETNPCMRCDLNKEVIEGEGYCIDCLKDIEIDQLKGRIKGLEEHALHKNRLIHTLQEELRKMSVNKNLLNRVLIEFERLDDLEHPQYISPAEKLWHEIRVELGY